MFYSRFYYFCNYKTNAAMNEEKPKTRIRRTNEQVDKAISDALTTAMP